MLAAAHDDASPITNGDTAAAQAVHGVAVVVGAVLLKLEVVTSCFLNPGPGQRGLTARFVTDWYSQR